MENTLTDNNPLQENTDNTLSHSSEKDIKEVREKTIIKSGILDIIEVILTFCCILFTVTHFNENDFDIRISTVHFAYFMFFAVRFTFREKQFRKEAVFPAIMLCLLYLSYGLFAYYDILRLIFSCYLFGYTLCALSATKGFPIKSVSDIFTQLFALFLIPLKNILLPIKSFLANLKKAKLKKYGALLIGIILGIPVFLLAADLLSDADLAFHYVFSGTFKNLFEKIDDLICNFNMEVENIITALFMTPFIYSFIFSAEKKITKETLESGKIEKAVKRMAFLRSAVLLGFYSVISICYVVFIISQFNYLFSAFSGTPAYGYSLSAYARQGFFEMSGVAILNLCLIASGVLFAKRTDKGDLPKIFRFFSLFFCLFTVLLIIIASSKMILYVKGLGLTEKRVAVLIADIILFITFILIPIKLFKKDFPCLKTVTSLALSAVCFMLVFSADTLVCNFNTAMYLSGHHKKIDLITIKNSDHIYSAAKNLEKLTFCENESTANFAKSQLFMLYDDYKSFINSRYTLDAKLFSKFAETKLKKTILSYESFVFEDDSIIYGNFLEHKQNFTATYLSFCFEIPSVITKVKIENSLLNKELANTDSSPLNFEENIYIYDWFTLKSDALIAKITLFRENGEEIVFELRKDDDFTIEDKDRGLNIGETDFFRGTFKAKENGYIYLVTSR